VLIQYPNNFGSVEDYSKLAEKIHAKGASVVVATDLLSLTMLKPPGEWGADIVVGSSQRFGVPLGFGGPHAGFLATQEQHKRKIPGRLIGVSVDSRGKRALRMAMQTREQHIRRDRATSNICTAQALLANVAASYGIYHGPHGLRDIALKVHGSAKILSTGLEKLGFRTVYQNFFDTITVDVSNFASSNDVFDAAVAENCTIRVINENLVGLSCDEETSGSDLDALFRAFAKVSGARLDFTASGIESKVDPDADLKEFKRSSSYMTHPIFNSHHSETEMMRYLFSLQSKDLSLQTAMIPLGSCTMKLNAASEMIPVTWPEVNGLHPFVPPEHSQGYNEMLRKLGKDLAEITGFYEISFQPNSGSQGEYAGLWCIRAYHESRGDHHRNVCLIPISAHGTNPASAVMVGMKVVVVKCDEDGNIDIEDLKVQAEKHKEKYVIVSLV
jgi:glycine dehydrogenase